jgi:large subunit ribosomal protein L13
VLTNLKQSFFETGKVMSLETQESGKNLSKTWLANSETAERGWWIVDASGQRLGRIATHVATLLRGKHKPTFTPGVDTGDFVVVINCDKIQLTGTKWESKKYFSHSRYFGSLKEKTAAQMKTEDSTFIIKEAVRGMLPTSRLNYSVISKLKAFNGAEHTHQAQKPQPYAIVKK